MMMHRLLHPVFAPGVPAEKPARVFLCRWLPSTVTTKECQLQLFIPLGTRRGGTTLPDRLGDQCGSGWWWTSVVLVAEKDMGYFTSSVEARKFLRYSLARATSSR